MPCIELLVFDCRGHMVFGCLRKEQNNGLYPARIALMLLYITRSKWNALVVWLSELIVKTRQLLGN